MIQKKDIEKAERIISALSKCKLEITGLELVQFAQAFEWLAIEIHKAKTYVEPEIQEAQPEQAEEIIKKSKKTKG